MYTILFLLCGVVFGQTSSLVDQIGSLAICAVSKTTINTDDNHLQK